MFPNDAHGPQHYIDKPEIIKKVTLKVKCITNMDIPNIKALLFMKQKSERVPEKNTRTFCGKPLVSLDYWKLSPEANIFPKLLLIPIQRKLQVMQIKISM